MKQKTLRVAFHVVHINILSKLNSKRGSQLAALKIADFTLSCKLKSSPLYTALNGLPEFLVRGHTSLLLFSPQSRIFYNNKMTQILSKLFHHARAV
jgi:hypothetical protein